MQRIAMWRLTRGLELNVRKGHGADPGVRATRDGRAYAYGPAYLTLRPEYRPHLGQQATELVRLLDRPRLVRGVARLESSGQRHQQFLALRQDAGMRPDLAGPAEGVAGLGQDGQAAFQAGEQGPRVGAGETEAECLGPHLHKAQRRPVVRQARHAATTAQAPASCAHPRNPSGSWTVHTDGGLRMIRQVGRAQLIGIAAILALFFATELAIDGFSGSPREQAVAQSR